MERAECDAQWLAGKNQGKHREHVREALIGAVGDELVDERLRPVPIEAVEELPALPHTTADHRLLLHDVERALRVDMQCRSGGANRGERASTLEAYLEPQIVEAEHQAV